MSFRFPSFQSTHLSQILGSRTSARAVSFLYALLAWNPSWRSSAQEALRHSYFRMSNNNNGVKSDHIGHHSTLSSEDSYSNNNKVEIEPHESMLSLSLRPRNNHEKDNNPAKHNSDISTNRLPLQMTEIEPHFSRDLSRPFKPESGHQRPKSPPQPVPQPLQPPVEIKDEDLNDLISAFSLESTVHRNRVRNSRSKFVILSPSKSKLAKIEALGASPGTLRIPRRSHHNVLPPQPQRHRTFQVQNAYTGLNFSPTTTKFTLLYGHHQPATIKIVSPAKLGLQTSDHQHIKQEEAKAKIEEIMGKRMATNKLFTSHQAPPVYRSLPDFSPKKPSHQMLTPTKKKSLAFPVAPDPSINIHGKGLGEVIPSEKQRIHVRPDWASKYLK